MKKTVLVTGGTGFIGRATIEALRKEGWQITLGSRSPTGLMGCEVLHLNLAEPETILALKKGKSFDAIVHLGAHVAFSDIDESEMFIANSLATGCLAYLAKLWDSHLIYASTVIVHGIHSQAINCNSLINNDTAYARSKWIGEQLIESSIANHCILRIGGVFGHRGPSHLGLNRTLDAAIRGEAPVQRGSALALRNYVYVKDVAMVITHALKRGTTGTHLLAGSEVLMVKEMLELICQVFTPSFRPIIEGGPRAPDQVVSCSSELIRPRRFIDALIDIKKVNKVEASFDWGYPR